MVDFAVWKDEVFVTGVTTLDYYVTVDGAVAYQGRAKADTDGQVRINVRRLVKDHLWNEFRDFLPLQGEVVAHPEAMRVFGLYEADSTALLAEYRVLFDFTDEWNGGNLQMNEPIDGHADPRQKIFIGNASPISGDEDNPNSGSTQDIEDIPVTGDFFRVVNVPYVPYYGGVYCIGYATSYDWHDITVTYPSGLTLNSMDDGSVCFTFPENLTSRVHTFTVCFKLSGQTLECVIVRQGAFSYEDSYLTIEAEAPYLLVLRKWESSDVEVDGQFVSPTEYRLEGGEWTHMPRKSVIGNAVYGNVLNVTTNKVMLRSKDCGPQPEIICYDYQYPNVTNGFHSTVDYIAYGNILSMEYGDNFVGVKEFDKRGCRLPAFGGGLTDAGNLVIPMTVARYNGTYTDSENPPVTWDMGACTAMFSYCEKLTVPPTFNFTKIEAYGCYDMFRACPFTVAQDMEATEYGESACAGMYWESGIVKGPKIYAVKASTRAFTNMFSTCEGLTETAEFMHPVNVFGNGRVFEGMYNACEALTTTHPITIANVKTRDCKYNFASIYRWCWKVTSAEFGLKNVDDEEFVSAFDCSDNVDHNSRVNSITVRAESFEPYSGIDYNGYFRDWLEGHSVANGVMYLTQVASDRIARNSNSGVPSGWGVIIVE